MVLLAGGFCAEVALCEEVALWSEAPAAGAPAPEGLCVEVALWSAVLAGGCDVVEVVEVVSVVVELAGGWLADVLPVPTEPEGVWLVTGGLVGPVVLCPGAAAPV